MISFILSKNIPFVNTNGYITRDIMTRITKNAIQPYKTALAYILAALQMRPLSPLSLAIYDERILIREAKGAPREQKIRCRSIFPPSVTDASSGTPKTSSLIAHIIMITMGSVVIIIADTEKSGRLVG